MRADQFRSRSPFSGLRRFPRLLTSMLLILAGLITQLQAPASGAAANPSVNLTAALTNTTLHQQRNGFDVTITSPGTASLQVSRKGLVALYRIAGKPLMYTTPVAAIRSTDQISDSAIAHAARSAGQEWVRYEQYTPQAFPDLASLTALGARPSAKVTSTVKANRTTYVITPYKSTGQSWTVTTVKAKKSAPELITNVVVRDRKGALLNVLARMSGQRDLPAAKDRSISFSFRTAGSQPTAPALTQVFALVTNPQVLNVTRYDQTMLTEVARDVLFAANRYAEADNRSVTGVELNAALVRYHPHEYPGLGLRAVEGRLQLSVLSAPATTLYCAQLVRFDYTNESLSLLPGAC
jgi:hypothetical protein